MRIKARSLRARSVDVLRPPMSRCMKAKSNSAQSNLLESGAYPRSKLPSTDINDTIQYSIFTCDPANSPWRQSGRKKWNYGDRICFFAFPWWITTSWWNQYGHFYRTTLCLCDICNCPVSVCPSIRLSQASVPSKRLAISSRKKSQTVPNDSLGLPFSGAKVVDEIQTGSPHIIMVTPNIRGVDN